MLRLLRSRKAQNTAEYAIMIAIVIGAFSVMQIYLKRGMQAKVRAGMDSIPGIVEVEAGTNIFGAEQQYEPLTSSDMTTVSSEGKETATVTESGGMRDLTNATTKRTGEQKLY